MCETLLQLYVWLLIRISKMCKALLELIVIDSN